MEEIIPRLQNGIGPRLLRALSGPLPAQEAALSCDRISGPCGITVPSAIFALRIYSWSRRNKWLPTRMMLGHCPSADQTETYLFSLFSSVYEQAVIRPGAWDRARPARKGVELPKMLKTTMRSRDPAIFALLRPGFLRAGRARSQARSQVGGGRSPMTRKPPESSFIIDFLVLGFSPTESVGDSMDNNNIIAALLPGCNFGHACATNDSDRRAQWPAMMPRNTCLKTP